MRYGSLYQYRDVIDKLKKTVSDTSYRELISKRNMGIFMVDHAPRKIRTLENLAPLFIITPATGNVPYKGPVAASSIKGK